MDKIDLHRVDLDLLFIFEMIMQERNVRGAAERLCLDDAEVERALTRLYRLRGDPLFDRIGDHLRPTMRAITLEVVLRPLLDIMSDTVRQTRLFDPVTSSDVIRLGLSDDAELGLLAQLMSELTLAAPKMVVVVRRINYLTIKQQLASGQISLGICYTPDQPANTNSVTLRRGQSVMIHATLKGKPITLDEYCERPHALVSLAGDLSGFIEQELRGLGRARHVTRTIPQFHGLRSLLPGTLLIATVPDYAAAALTANGQLRSEPLPFPAPIFDLSLTWGTTFELDPAHRWLRNKMMGWIGKAPLH